jgi:hypothetical protein
MEVIDALEALGLDDDFCLAKAFCYIARSRYKGSEVQDLNKAIWYLKRKAERVYRNENPLCTEAEHGGHYVGCPHKSETGE